MTKDRVRATDTVLSRRTFCAAIPTLPFVDVRTAQDTPILRLFGEWAELSRRGWTADDDELDGLADRMLEIEDEMGKIPSKSVADLAAKLAAVMDWGMSELPEDSHIWAEVRSLVPVWRPSPNLSQSYEASHTLT